MLEEKWKEEEWVRHSLPKLNEESVAPGDAITLQITRKMLKQAITFLNPDQIPVIAVDQPLFAL